MAPAAELQRLHDAIQDACAETDEWAAGVAAGINAGIEFAIAHPGVGEALHSQLESEAEQIATYDRLVRRLTAVLQENSPTGSRLPGSTDEALIAGVVGLVGDYLRLGRSDRLSELCPDLILLVLLPYLGFEDAQRWANSPRR